MKFLLSMCPEWILYPFTEFYINVMAREPVTETVLLVIAVVFAITMLFLTVSWKIGRKV